MEIPMPDRDFHDCIPMPSEYGCEPPPPGVDFNKIKQEHNKEKPDEKIEISEKTRLSARELIEQKLTQLKQKAREEAELIEQSRARQRSAEREAEQIPESDRIIDQLFKTIKERESEAIKQGEEHIAQLNADMEKINEELAKIEQRQKSKTDEDGALLDTLYDDVFGGKKKKKKSKDKKKHKEKKRKKDKEEKDPELDPNFFNVPSPTSLAKSFLELEEIDKPAENLEPVDREKSKDISNSRSRSREKSRQKKTSRDKSRSRSLSPKRSSSRSQKRSRSRDRKRSRSQGRRSRSRGRRSKSRDRRSRSRDRKMLRSRDRSSRSSYRDSHRSSSSRYSSYHGDIRDARDRIRGRRDRRRTRSRSRSRDRRSRSRSRSRDRHRKRKENDLFYIDKEKLRQIAIKRVQQMEMAGKSVYTLGGITSEDIAQIKSGGASLQEVTAFCKSLAHNKRPGDSSSSDESDVNVPIENDDSAGTIAAQFITPKLATIKMNIKNAKQLPIQAPEEKAKLRSSFPVSSGTHHRKDEPNEWTPVPASESQKPVFDEQSDESDTDIGILIAKRLKAVKKLKNNPEDTETKATVAKLDEKALRWGKKANLPGEFTGRVETSFLTPNQLAPSEDKKRQAWIRKDIFHRAAPVKGGIGKHLLMRMGWKEGEGLGLDSHGSLEPLVLDFNTTRKGLQAPEEKSKSAAKLASSMGPAGVARVGHMHKSFDLADKNPISALMEICSKRRWDPPKWETIHESGPSHKKTFLIQVTINGVTYQPSMASNNKKVAKAHSATTALQAMGLVPRETPAAVLTVPNPANPTRNPVQPPNLLSSTPQANPAAPRPQPVRPVNYKEPSQRIAMTAVPTHLPVIQIPQSDPRNPVMFDDLKPRQTFMNNIDLSSFR